MHLKGGGSEREGACEYDGGIQSASDGTDLSK